MKKFRWITLAFMAVCFALFFYYGFTQQPCDLDSIYLYCRMHPFTGADVIGCILFVLGCLSFGQLWTFFWPNMDDEQPGKSIVLGGFVAAVVGIGIIWLA